MPVIALQFRVTCFVLTGKLTSVSEAYVGAQDDIRCMGQL